MQSVQMEPPGSNQPCYPQIKDRFFEAGLHGARLHWRFMKIVGAHMAMGQNPVPPVNIPIPTKID